MSDNEVEPYHQESEHGDRTGLTIRGNGVRMHVEYSYDELEELAEDIEEYLDEHQD